MRIDNNITAVQLYAEIGSRLKRCRIECGLKQEELAARCGVSRSALIKLEKGDGGTRIATFLAVSRQLNLLGGLEVMLPEIIVTPHEQLMIERNRRTFPKTVRDHKKAVKPRRVWGDGVAIDGGAR